RWPPYWGIRPEVPTRWSTTISARLAAPEPWLTASSGDDRCMDHFPGSPDPVHDLPRRFCPACGRWTSQRFKSGPGARPDARCPHCRSLERQRFLAVLTSCLGPVVEVDTLLDIAPAPCTTTV